MDLRDYMMYCLVMLYGFSPGVVNSVQALTCEEWISFLSEWEIFYPWLVCVRPSEVTLSCSMLPIVSLNFQPRRSYKIFLVMMNVLTQVRPNLEDDRASAVIHLQSLP